MFVIVIWLLSGIEAQPQRGNLLSSVFSTVGQVAQAARPIISASRNPSYRPNIIRDTFVGQFFPENQNQLPPNSGGVFETQCNTRCNSPCFSLVNCRCRQNNNCFQNRYPANNQNNHRPNNFHSNHHQSSQFNQISVSKPRPSKKFS